MKIRNQLFQLSLPLILVIGIFIFYIFIINKLHYQADEYEWVGRSYFFDLYIRGDFKNELWQSYFSYDQPKITYYIFGASLYPSYLQSKESSFLNYLNHHQFFQNDLTKYPQWNLIQDNYDVINKNDINILDCKLHLCDTLSLIQRVRLVNAVLLTIATFLVYYIARFLGGKMFSIGVALLWGLHPIIRENCLLAISEASFLLFFNMSIFLLFRLITSRRMGNKDTLFLGITIALCFSTKIHGIILFFISVLFFILREYNKAKNIKKLSIKQILKHILLLVFSLTFISYVVNPFLWPNPFQRMNMILTHRWETAKEQQNLYRDDALPNPQARILSIYKTLFPTFKTHTHKIIYIAELGTLALFVYGVVSLLKDSRNDIRSEYFLLLTLFFIVSLSFFLLLSWQRYYNILVLPFILILVIGLKALLHLLFSRWFKILY